jgi:regulator of ribosome biosynthesis
LISNHGNTDNNRHAFAQSPDHIPPTLHNSSTRSVISLNLSLWPNLLLTSLRSVTVTKPIPYVFDAAHLLAVDPNPLPPPSTTAPPSTYLPALARDGAQSLLSHLLLSVPISTPSSSGPMLHLPPPTNLLPRRLPLPKPKAPTKWETFARKKGIGKFGGNASGGAAREERRKNLVFDEEKGEWVRKWGYKGRNMEGKGEWLVEVDEKKVKKEEQGEGGNVKGLGKRERMERVRRQERKKRNNERRGKKGGER